MEVGFRRRKRAKKEAAAASAGEGEGTIRLKKRVRREEEEEDKDKEQEEEDDNALEVVQEILEDQKLRRLHQKVADKPRASQSQPQQAKPQATEELSSYGLHDPKKDGSATKKLVTLLDGQFTGQSSTSQRDQHEELMNKYIEEKLRSKHQQQSQDAENQQDMLTLQDEEDQLYALPEHLRVSNGSRGNVQQNQQQPADEDDSANGSVLVWSTGIAEVELPSDFQKHTVEATKKALQRDLSSKSRAKGHSQVQSSALPTNFSTDFNRHRRDFVQELKQLPIEDKRERGFRKVARDAPSDDLAVDRFRKQESRRKFR